MRPIVTRYLAVALILCVPATLVAAPKPPKKLDTSEKSAQTFHYKHKAGEKLLYTNGVIQEMELEVMGGDLPIPNTATRTSMIAKIIQETTKVLPSGEAEVQTTYDDLEIEISQGPKMVDKAQLAPMVDQLKKIKSVSRLTAQGEQKAFEVQGAPGAQNMNESLRSALIGAQPKFPEKAIKIIGKAKANPQDSQGSADGEGLDAVVFDPPVHILPVRLTRLQVTGRLCNVFGS